MESSELLQRARRQAILESLAVVEPDAAQARFRRLLEAGSGSLNEWDERFARFIAEHRGQTLLGGTAGDDIHFIFSPEARAGFWVVNRATLRGKGFFMESDVARLMSLAREKALVPA